MIDITNKSDEEINVLIAKYANVLEIFQPEAKQYIAYMINIAVNHIEENHKNLSSYWKAWIIITLKKYFDNIKTEADITKIIDEFIIFHNIKYQQYCENVVSVDEWYKDEGFINYFINP